MMDKTDTFSANTLFVLATCNKLIPLMILKSEEPVCMFAYPGGTEDTELDLLKDERFLKTLTKVDGMPIAQFKEYQKNPEMALQGMTFKSKEDEENQVESIKARFGED